MRNLLAIASAAALATLSTAALAQTDAPVAKTGRLLISSDGKRLGRIDRVEAARVGVIVDSTYIYIPTATLSAGENNRVLTSLSYKDIVRR